MFQRCVFVVSVSRPSNPFVFAFIAPWSVGTSECARAFIAEPSVGTSGSGCRLRLRTSGPVQSSLSCLSLVSFVCCLVCALCCVLRVFASCFGVFLSAFVPLGLQPKLLAGPWRALYFSLFSCLCSSLLSMSCSYASA